MVNVAAIMNIVTTILTFVEGVADQVVPIINKILDKRTTLPPQPAAINPNCHTPYCGVPPYFCPDVQLSALCLQRRMAAENNAAHRRTTLSTKNDDNDERKDESSSSMSPGSMIMVVFVGVIVLAIIGFLFIRCNQQNDNTRNYDDRKSSTWTV